MALNKTLHTKIGLQIVGIGFLVVAPGKMGNPLTTG